MKTFLFYFVLIIILVASYNLESYVLEDVQIMSVTGYDYVDKDTIKGTVATPFYPQGQNVQPINVSFTATGHTVYNIRQEYQREAQKKLAAGRLRSFLISKELAEHGVKKIIDPLSRSTFIGRDMKLAVVDGSTEKLLTADYPNAQNLSRYLSDLLEDSIIKMAPTTELHTFLAQLAGFGQDPFLPIIKKEHSHIRYMGVALFKDDRYVGELPFKDSYIFKMLHENFRHGVYEIKYKETYITIENLRSKVKYSISGSKKSPVVTISVSLKGKVQDASGLSLHTAKKVQGVEEEWKKETKKRAEKVVKKLQELNTDSLGIGEKVRSHFRHFNKDSWEDRYPDVPIYIKVETEITNTGITE